MPTLTDLAKSFPFEIHINTATLAGLALWALALYLGFSPIGDWVTEQLNRWLNFAERFTYTSQEEYERNRKAWESMNAFYASLLSIVPFLVAGGLCNYGIEVGLGRSWAISMGLLACMGAGVYELGRRDGQSSDG